MAIISESDRAREPHYGNSQLRQAVVYVLITTAVLLFLNFYCSRTSLNLFYQSKQASMIEKVQLAASEIADLEVLNPANVSAAVSEMGSLRVTRLIVTDSSGMAIFDSLAEGSEDCVLLPEVVQALRGNNAFTCHYADAVMESRAATPVLSGGVLMGCIYMMEYDTTSGALMASLQKNIFTITVVLELLVGVLSFAFAGVFSLRLRQILNSIRIIRSGDYSHRVAMGGRDGLTALGDEFNNLTDRLQVSEQKQRQFVSDASHELKTPLASIKLLSDSILQNDMDMDTIREFVSDIGDEAERLNRMSQKLLALTRADAQTDVDNEIIPMGPTIQRVTRMLSAIAEKTGIAITTDLSGDCTILIPEDDLYQIAFNLVENGIKYNTPGGSLAICLRQEEDDAILEVSDTGVGIPQEAIDQIFERFYRVDKARSRRSGSSGLGLAIVRDMVERNHGTIHVRSTLGQGSTFTVSFPIFDMGTPIDAEVAP